MSGATLTSDARVLEAARWIGARTGVDYTDDTAVTALLNERRRAMEAAQHGLSAWLGGVAAVGCVVWPFMSAALTSPADKPAVVFGPTAAFLVVAAVALSRVRYRWKRELTHPALTGYRQLLGIARAHGLPLTHVPAWLEGRASDGGKGAAPVPSYAETESAPLAAGPAAVPPKPAAVSPHAPAVPPMPAAVVEYEQALHEGGWHNEAGCLLLFAGVAGPAWAVTEDAPLGSLLVALVPLAILVWRAGSRQGRRQEALRAEAMAYVKAVAEAQAAGVPVPELSPVLRKLLDEQDNPLHQ